MTWKVYVCPKRMRSPGINGEGGSPGKMAVKMECVCVCVVIQIGWHAIAYLTLIPRFALAQGHWNRLDRLHITFILKFNCNCIFHSFREIAAQVMKLWCKLHDPRFSLFDKIPGCNKLTHGHGPLLTCSKMAKFSFNVLLKSSRIFFITKWTGLLRPVSYCMVHWYTTWLCSTLWW